MMTKKDKVFKSERCGAIFTSLGALAGDPREGVSSV